MSRPPPIIYLLKITPIAGGDGIRALRWALKAMLRRFGLRCISIEKVTS